MIEIMLTQGKRALIDETDASRVWNYKWYALFDRYNWYAIRRVKKKGNWSHQSMHIFLMNPPQGVDIDHRDRNGLNNQRNNLRICTHQQNMRNKRISVGNASGFKGVCWKPRIKKWIAQIRYGKVLHLGCFEDKKEAARAYDSAAEKFFGEFALTNKKLGLL